MSTLAKKTKILIDEGYPPKQAYAIAHTMLRKAKKKGKNKKSEAVLVCPHCHEATPIILRFDTNQLQHK